MPFMQRREPHIRVNGEWTSGTFAPNIPGVFHKDPKLNLSLSWKIIESR